jgi:hypothetical protein
MPYPKASREELQAPTGKFRIIGVDLNGATTANYHIGNFEALQTAEQSREGTGERRQTHLHLRRQQRAGRPLWKLALNTATSNASAFGTNSEVCAVAQGRMNFPTGNGMNSMLDKCANSDCLAVFHRLRDGRLFAYDQRVIQGRATGSHSGPKTHGHQYHWLCNECCKTLTLAFKDSSTVAVVPKQPISTPSPRLPSRISEPAPEAPAPMANWSGWRRRSASVSGTQLRRGTPRYLSK